MRHGVLDAFWLKIILCILMVLDHIYFYIPDQPVWLNMLGRLVAPTFTFLMAQGMVYTRNRAAYIGRLFLAGFIMLSVNLQINAVYGYLIPNSILMSLGIAASIIACLDQFLASRSLLWLPAAAVLLGLSLAFEGMFLVPVMAVIFYYLREKPLAMYLVYMVSTAAMLFLLGQPTIQYLMLLAVVPISLYNGQRGYSSRFAKYFFYVFYPLHVWILYFIGVWKFY